MQRLQSSGQGASGQGASGQRPSNRRRLAIHHVSQRAGVSLLEVVISVAIFLAALTAILSLLDMGNQSRLSVSLDAKAAILCESAMAEYISGIREVVGSTDEPVENEDNWSLTTTVEPADGESLLKVTVLIKHTVNGDNVNSSFRLMRLMRDPQLFMDAAMAASEEE